MQKVQFFVEELFGKTWNFGRQLSRFGNYFLNTAILICLQFPVCSDKPFGRSDCPAHGHPRSTRHWPPNHSSSSHTSSQPAFCLCPRRHSPRLPSDSSNFSPAADVKTILHLKSKSIMSVVSANNFFCN